MWPLSEFEFVPRQLCWLLLHAETFIVTVSVIRAVLSEAASLSKPATGESDVTAVLWWQTRVCRRSRARCRGPLYHSLHNAPSPPQSGGGCPRLSRTRICTSVPTLLPVWSAWSEIATGVTSNKDRTGWRAIEYWGKHRINCWHWLGLAPYTNNHVITYRTSSALFAWQRHGEALPSWIIWDVVRPRSKPRYHPVFWAEQLNLEAALSYGWWIIVWCIILIFIKGNNPVISVIKRENLHP